MRMMTAGLTVMLACASGALAWAAPQFSGDGRLVVPADIAAWPVAGTTYAVSYEGDGAGTTFNTVRIDPASYAAYLKSGNFPAGTMLSLEVRAAKQEIAPAKSGHVQGDVVNRSLHVKDEKAGPGSWTFYTGTGATPGKPFARDADCYSCHQREAKQDIVFMQFYPSLIEARAQQK